MSGPRLIDDLRRRTDPELLELLTARPDLVTPVPPDLAGLGQRALARWSVVAALERLSLWELELAQALVALPASPSYDAVTAALDAPADAVAAGLDRLRTLAVAWGDRDRLAVAPPLADLLPPMLPMPVHPAAPMMRGRRVEPDRAARTAAGAAATVVARVEELLEVWGDAPPPVLKAGGLGVRELRRAAALLDVDEAAATVVVETAYAAGLLAATPSHDAEWLPTPAYDEWRARPMAHRWVTLAAAWLDSPRAAGALEPDLAAAPLSGGRAFSGLPEVRRAALVAVGSCRPGATPTPDEVVEALRWAQPIRTSVPAVRAALHEAELLGVTGLGALPAAGRALLAGDPVAAADAVGPLLPPAVETVVLQADLTVVAPGPLEPQLARELRLLADVESRGGATVYRFRESSLRRAFDAGYTASDVHRFLADRSRTPVPQPLSYLVDDVARRHGRVRVGSARAFVRCDDPALLAEVLAHRRTGPLRLRRIAPTVLVSTATVSTVLDVLRGAGFAPGQEAPDGAVVLTRPGARRTPALPRPPVRAPWPPEPRPELLAAATRALRAGERAARHRPEAGQPTSIDPRTTLALLRAAAAEGGAVWIGYVNANGIASQRVVEPVAVQGGFLTAYDSLRDEIRTFAVHRITAARPVVEETVGGVGEDGSP